MQKHDQIDTILEEYNSLKASDKKAIEKLLSCDEKSYLKALIKNGKRKANKAIEALEENASNFCLSASFEKNLRRLVGTKQSSDHKKLTPAAEALLRDILYSTHSTQIDKALSGKDNMSTAHPGEMLL